MTTALSRTVCLFDGWLHRGDFTRSSLAIYRIVFGVLLLVLELTDRQWLANYPDSFYRPRPGPFELFSGFPPEPILISLEIVIALSAAAIVLGVRTLFASLTFTITAIVANGFVFSAGKIEHDILLLLTPAFLGLAGWGDRFSFDAHRRAAQGVTAPQHAEHWPLRLFALIIAWSLFTAAYAKILGGWLNTNTQATHNALIRQIYADNVYGDFSAWVAQHHVPWLWEIADWSTVLLEASLLFAVFSWRACRYTLSVLTLFHLGVMAILMISFQGNVIVYGSFVLWHIMPGARRIGEIITRYRPPVVPGLTQRTAETGSVIGIGMLAWFIHEKVPTPEWAAQVVIVIGSLIATGYLLHTMRHLNTRRSMLASPTPPPSNQRAAQSDF